MLILNNRPQDALFDHFWMTTTLLTIDNVIFCGFGFYPFPFATNNSKANACVRCRMLCMSSLLHSSFSLLINSLNEWFSFCLNFCGLIGFDGLKKANTHTHTLHTIIIMCSKTMFDRCGSIETFKLKRWNRSKWKMTNTTHRLFMSVHFINHTVSVYACSVHRMACVYWSCGCGCAVFVIKIEWFAHFSDFFFK